MEDLVEVPRRKKRRMSEAARARISARMKKLHEERKKEAEREAGPKNHPKFRLVVYGNNPNSGATELHAEVTADSMNDLLMPIIDSFYDGVPKSLILIEEL